MARSDCLVCGGSGWKIVDSDAASRVAVRCECGSSDRTSRIFDRARIPPQYSKCDFVSYEEDVPSEKASKIDLAGWALSLGKAKTTVQGFVREFPFGSDQGLLIMGPHGVGKTHLAVAALKELLVRGHGGLFYDYRELLREIQDSYNSDSNKTEMGILDPVLKAEVLLLDDVGASKPSDWVLDTVGYILNSRYNEKRTTIITTNYSDGRGFGRLQGDDGPREGWFGRDEPIRRDETLVERIGSRVRSRLYEMCATVFIVAPDRRELRQGSTGRF